MIEIEVTTDQTVDLIEVVGAGPQGATGGIPDGGTTGQILAKASDDNQDTEWSSDYANAAQGQLADTAVQPGDNVSTLTNDANYIDAAGAPVQSVDGFTGAVDLSGEYDALGSAAGVQSNLTSHTSATTNVHGIADTSQLIVEGDARLTDERVPTDGSVTDAKVSVSADIAPSKIAGTAVVDNDSRLTDQRVPTDGSVTDAKIVSGGLSPSSVTGTAVINSDARLSDERTPVDGSVTDAKITAGGLAPSSITGTAVIDSDARLSDERVPVDGSVTSAKIDAAGLAPTDISGTAVIDSDARLSDERTPLDASVTDAKVAANAEIAQSKISGLTASLDGKANLVGGKVPQSELPAIAFTEVYVVADIAERDALTAQEGDVAIVQDDGSGQSASYIYDGANWQELLTPTDGVSSVTASGGLTSTGGTTPDISITDSGVTTAKIGDGQITNVKLAGSIDPAKITGTAVVDGDARLSEGAAGSETVRSLGTGATQALPGNYDVAGQAPVQSVASKTGDVTLVSSDVGLGNVPNLDTTDAVNKAHDQNTDTALDLGGLNEVTAADARAHIDATDNPHGVTKAQVGLGDVDNVSAADLRDRATHTGTQTLSTILDAGTIASQDADNVSITGGSIDASIVYDNTNSNLTATLVQTAIDELDQKKLNVSALTSSVKFFPTTAAGAVSGYGRLVTDTGDADYDDPAVDVTVGPFTGTGQLLGSLVSDAGVLEGNTTPINVTTIGNVRRSSGSVFDRADFYFEVYKRDSGGTETLIGTSSNTAEVSSDDFQEFFADCLIQDTLFTATDRLVLKFYGNVRAGGGGETYQFQYGGSQPVRTLFPVPVTVVPNGKTAADVQVDASGFSGLLSGTDDDVQSALDTLDDVTKSDIGLGNVDNTSDLDKPISTATQSALDDKADKVTQIIAGTGLDGGGDLSANRTLDLSAATQSSLGLADTSVQPGDNVSDLTNDANYIDSAGAPVQSVNAKTGAVVLDKSDVGLGNVDNTSDLNKPISTDTQNALNGKADKTITITGSNGIEGGGDLTANRALSLTAATLASLNLADSALQSGDPATDIAYDNTASGLTATTVQGAIDEIVGILSNVLELNTGS